MGSRGVKRNFASSGELPERPACAGFAGESMGSVIVRRDAIHHRRIALFSSEDEEMAGGSADMLIAPSGYSISSCPDAPGRLQED